MKNLNSFGKVALVLLATVVIGGCGDTTSEVLNDVEVDTAIDAVVEEVGEVIDTVVETETKTEEKTETKIEEPVVENIAETAPDTSIPPASGDLTLTEKAKYTGTAKCGTTVTMNVLNYSGSSVQIVVRNTVGSKTSIDEYTVGKQIEVGSCMYKIASITDSSVGMNFVSMIAAEEPVESGPNPLVLTEGSAAQTYCGASVSVSQVTDHPDSRDTFLLTSDGSTSAFFIDQYVSIGSCTYKVFDVDQTSGKVTFKM